MPAGDNPSDEDITRTPTAYTPCQRSAAPVGGISRVIAPRCGGLEICGRPCGDHRGGNVVVGVPLEGGAEEALGGRFLRKRQARLKGKSSES
jgi:hypothetical protein